MKLATFIADGETLAGEVVDDRVFAFAGGDSVRDVVAKPDKAARGERSWALGQVQLLAPVPEPGTIYAIGLNYAEHVRETGAQQPEQPLVFVKVRGSVAPPGGPIRCPEAVRRLDYEGELTIVMGSG